MAVYDDDPRYALTFNSGGPGASPYMKNATPGGGGWSPGFGSGPQPTFAGAYNPGAASAATAVKGLGFFGGLANMDPITASMIMTGAGQGLSAWGGAADRDAQRQMSREEIAARTKAADRDRALQATQTDPYTQMRSRQKQALLDMLLQHYTPARWEGNNLVGGMGGITPEAMKSIGSYFGAGPMASEENRFQDTASMASPYYRRTDMGNVGYPGSIVDKLPAPQVAEPDSQFGAWVKKMNQRKQPGVAAIPGGNTIA